MHWLNSIVNKMWKHACNIKIIHRAVTSDRCIFLEFTYTHSRWAWSKKAIQPFETMQSLRGRYLGNLSGGETESETAGYRDDGKKGSIDRPMRRNVEQEPNALNDFGDLIPINKEIHTWSSHRNGRLNVTVHLVKLCNRLMRFTCWVKFLVRQQISLMTGWPKMKRSQWL